VKHLKKYGYLGIFLISAIGNIAILSPAAPMVSAVGATIYNPFISSFITTLGAVFGELLAYSIGSAGNAYLPDSKWNTKIKEFMKINGSLTIFVLAIIPNPFFELAGITARHRDQIDRGQNPDRGDERHQYRKVAAVAADRGQPIANHAPDPAQTALGHDVGHRVHGLRLFARTAGPRRLPATSKASTMVIAVLS
jgi:hypothetical protein